MTFWESWELWVKMSFILACAITIVVGAGCCKLIWMQRNLKKHVKTLQEKQAEYTVLLTRPSVRERTRRSDIPFGVRALECGIEVEGIWVSRPGSDTTTYMRSDDIEAGYGLNEERRLLLSDDIVDESQSKRSDGSQFPSTHLRARSRDPRLDNSFRAISRDPNDALDTDWPPSQASESPLVQSSNLEGCAVDAVHAYHESDVNIYNHDLGERAPTPDQVRKPFDFPNNLSTTPAIPSSNEASEHDARAPFSTRVEAEAASNNMRAVNDGFSVSWQGVRRDRESLTMELKRAQRESVRPAQQGHTDMESCEHRHGPNRSSVPMLPISLPAARVVPEDSDAGNRPASRRRLQKKRKMKDRDIEHARAQLTGLSFTTPGAVPCVPPTRTKQAQSHRRQSQFKEHV